VNEQPMRLRDDAESVLARDLARARVQAASYDVGAGLSRFEAAIAGGAPLPPEPAAATTPFAAIGWGIGSVFAVAVVAIAVTRPWADSPAPTASTDLATPSEAAGDDELPARVASRVTPAPLPSALDVVTPSTAESSAAQSSDAPARSSRARPTRGTPRRSASDLAKAEPAAPNPQAEMTATRAAASALTTNPSRALELVARADREFSGGLFDEDRRGIAALAELQLGRASATAHANAYLRAHPKGTYAERLRRALSEGAPRQTP
jgi:hypothetical protein